MTVSLHLCEETLLFAAAGDGGDAKPIRVLNAAKLDPAGRQAFADTNTGSNDFAEGALAMLELLEATLGRAVLICHDSDPKLQAERSGVPAP